MIKYDKFITMQLFAVVLLIYSCMSACSYLYEHRLYLLLNAEESTYSFFFWEMGNLTSLMYALQMTYSVAVILFSVFTRGINHKGVLGGISLSLNMEKSGIFSW